MAEAKQKCAHDGCMCQVYPGQTYCGPYCATAAAEQSITLETGRCECGHEHCSAHGAVDRR